MSKRFNATIRLVVTGLGPVPALHAVRDGLDKALLGAKGTDGWSLRADRVDVSPIRFSGEPEPAADEPARTHIEVGLAVTCPNDRARLMTDFGQLVDDAVGFIVNDAGVGARLVSLQIGRAGDNGTAQMANMFRKVFESLSEGADADDE